ncbi:MAG: hypothetical protein NTX06_01560 [Proteobacteria bacterium]|nr:hypothetical protein [Pseudomonadota bacterium]
MIAYYEKQSQPPMHFLPVFAKVLGVSVDQLLGMQNHKAAVTNKDMRLWRRFNQIKKTTH